MSMPEKLFVRTERPVDEGSIDSEYLGSDIVYIGFPNPGATMECYRDGVTVTLGIYQLVGFVNATKSTALDEVEPR